MSICLFGPCNIASWWACCASGSFRLSTESGSIPLLIFLVNKCSAPFTFLYELLEFLQKFFYIDLSVFFNGNLFCRFIFCSQVWWYSLLPIICLLSNTFRCSFFFDVLLGFCRSSESITILLSRPFLSGAMFVHRFRSLEISSVNFLPAAPVDTITIFLWQWNICW